MGKRFTQWLCEYIEKNFIARIFSSENSNDKKTMACESCEEIVSFRNIFETISQIYAVRSCVSDIRNLVC